jgi:putative intracellular protease/amidase
MMKIGIILYDGFDALDAIGPWEAFRKAQREGAPLDVVFLVSEGPPRSSRAMASR